MPDPLSAEALARLEEAARAVMDSGPWFAVCMNGPLPDTVTTVDDDPICHALPEDVTYIAAASPDVVLALVQAALDGCRCDPPRSGEEFCTNTCVERARADKAEAEVRRLRAALEFYADPSMYEEPARYYRDIDGNPVRTYGEPPVWDDYGKRARAALAQPDGAASE
ncbi:MAG: hypothetical protein OJJ55_06595 [Rhodococcus sp.]|nr:hypothetical protein [Rhodococcus sp. (in: high G+C Gram-positive bacteria)]